MVVVSHEHLDHLDLDYLAGLPPWSADRRAALPLDDHAAPAPRAGRREVVVLDAWERYPLGTAGTG